MKPFFLDNLPQNTKEPFKVPAGYFENFAKELMSKLPEISDNASTIGKKVVSRSLWKQPLLYAASIVSVAIIGISAFHFVHTNENNNTEYATYTAQENSDYVDDFCNYARINHSEAYTIVNSEE